MTLPAQTSGSPKTSAHKLPIALIVVAGCAISMLSFGPRSSVGAFQRDILLDTQWTRDVFAIAIALQNLVWGLGQPFAGALADKFGATRVLIAGALFYALGLALMANAATPLLFDLSAGALVGLGLSGASFNLVLGAFGKLVPENRRSMAFGAATAAGSFGQFLFSPLAVGLIQSYGWRTTALVFAAIVLLIAPLAYALWTPPQTASKAAPGLTIGQALKQAFSQRSYMLLVAGYFTCGFQLAFITAHFQIYLTDLGLAPAVGAWAFALIGIFNIVGSLFSGWLGQRMPQRYILAFIYFSRALSTIVFVLLPASPASALLFGAVTGLLWLSTVPPTSSLVSLLFGPQHFSMLFGVAFVSHQLGGFLGALLGGVLYEATGSYAIVWSLSIALGLVSALLNLPIVEKPVAQPAIAA